MIGHIFTSSGAVVLAVAPSATHRDDYIVLALFEDTQYAVANVDMQSLPAPDHWLSGSYFQDNLTAAIEAFKEEAGLTASVEYLAEQVDRARNLLQVPR